MPPKTTVCSICNETVLKSTTRAVSDGKRACKSHDGVLEQADKLVADDKGRRDRAQEEAKKNRRNRFQSEGPITDASIDEHRDLLQNCCWSCGARGISQRVALLRSVAALDKPTVTGKPLLNLLMGEHIDVVNKDLKRQGLTILFTVPYEDRFEEKLKYKMRTIAHFSKITQLCRECVNKYSVKLPDVRPPKMSFEEMVTFGTIARDVLKPEIQRELAGLIERDKEE